MRRLGLPEVQISASKIRHNFAYLQTLGLFFVNGKGRAGGCCGAWMLRGRRGTPQRGGFPARVRYCCEGVERLEGRWSGVAWGTAQGGSPVQEWPVDWGGRCGTGAAGGARVEGFWRRAVRRVARASVCLAGAGRAGCGAERFSGTGEAGGVPALGGRRVVCGCWFCEVCGAFGRLSLRKTPAEAGVRDAACGLRTEGPASARGDSSGGYGSGLGSGPVFGFGACPRLRGDRFGPLSDAGSGGMLRVPFRRVEGRASSAVMAVPLRSGGDAAPSVAVAAPSGPGFCSRARAHRLPFRALATCESGG